MIWQRLWIAVRYVVAAIAARFTVPVTVPPTVPQNESPAPVDAPIVPVEAPVAHPLLKYDWSTAEAARHSTRLICDEEGLPLARDIKVNGKLYQLKDILCACIMQESRFKNFKKDGSPQRNDNYSIIEHKQQDGSITHERILSSTDWGIVQVNDRWHIGAGKDFPSVEYVLANPEECVRWMARLFKAGNANLWSSYKYKDYIQWL